MFPELRVCAGGRRFRGSSHPLLHWELLSLLSPALPFRSLSLSLPLFSPSPSFFSLSFFLFVCSLSRPLSPSLELLPSLLCSTVHPCSYSFSLSLPPSLSLPLPIPLSLSPSIPLSPSPSHPLSFTHHLFHSL